MRWMGVGLLSVTAAGCDQPTFVHPAGPPSCEISEVALANDGVASNGLTAAMVLAQARDQFDEVVVDWGADSVPTTDTLRMSFGGPTAVAEVSQSPRLDETGCLARTWVEVSVPMVLSSASGEVTGEGVVSLRGFNEGQLEVFGVTGPSVTSFPVSLSGDYLAAANADEDETLDVAGLGMASRGYQSDDALAQYIGISGQWLRDVGGSVGGIYGCDTSEADCLTFID